MKKIVYQDLRNSNNKLHVRKSLKDLQMHLSSAIKNSKEKYHPRLVNKLRNIKTSSKVY